MPYRKKTTHGLRGSACRTVEFEDLESRLLLTSNWQNPVNPLNVSGEIESYVSPVDVLHVVNELNDPHNSDPKTGKLDTRLERQAPFVDVDGDGYVSPVDALRVINALNRRTVTISESGSLVRRFSRVVEVGGAGFRTLEVEISSSFDTSDTESLQGDVFQVLLTDQDTGTSLLSDGPLFTLSESGTEYEPGLVRFEGERLAIELATITGSENAVLTFQLLNGDDDQQSSVVVKRVSNNIEEGGLLSPTFARLFSEDAPREEIDIESLTVSDTISTRLTNVEFDLATGIYRARLTAENNGDSIGRDLAVVFPGLPEDVDPVNASGVTANGVPYWSLKGAVPSGGLQTGAESGFVEIAFENPNLHRLSLKPEVLIGLPNQAPRLDPISNVSLIPGEVVRIAPHTTDADGDDVTVSLGLGSTLPTSVLDADGSIVLRPRPEDLGTYKVTLSANDGALSTTQVFEVQVTKDPIATTRLTGVVLNTLKEPLVNVPVEIGELTTTTNVNGAFTFEFAGAPPADTLIIRGELEPSETVYPYIAEKLWLLFDREDSDPAVFSGALNVVERPIYLPPLDVTGGTEIVPGDGADDIVHQEIAPDEIATVHVADRTLKKKLGDDTIDFDGVLSITEVPPSRTPAALPENLLPDVVVTIQPGEMEFTQPALLTLPNRAGYSPGSQMTLWSINPVTGVFDDVGTGKSVWERRSDRNRNWRNPQQQLALFCAFSCQCPRHHQATDMLVRKHTSYRIQSGSLFGSPDRFARGRRISISRCFAKCVVGLRFGARTSDEARAFCF